MQVLSADNGPAAAGDAAGDGANDEDANSPS